ncbi:MAG: hypothetical protein KBG28_07065 [Kofleriaceae bacterium]|nr:hypothetical protein [Kofleriaceae bacterium]
MSPRSRGDTTRRRSPRASAGRGASTSPASGGSAAGVDPLVGRGHERAELGRMLADGARLVVITGPGGLGKTRVLTQLVADQADAFAAHGGGGAWLIDATEVTSAADLAATTAAALGVRGHAGTDAVAALGRVLARRARLLLAFDNLEQVVDQAGAALTAWLAAAPALHVVATSRVPLPVAAAQHWPLAPLPVPAPGATPAAIVASDAGQLFMRRLRARHPGLTLSDPQLDEVAEIVRRLGGVPLAIELAAARGLVLTPAQILARLDDPLALLAQGGGGRHASIRRTLDDSLAALPDEGRRGFSALAVFHGGVDVDAIAAVAGGRFDPVLAMSQLGDSGLVLRAVNAGAWRGRFTVLETVRQLAHEEASTRGELAALAQAHAAHFTRRAADARARWARDPEAALAAIGADRANLGAALRTLTAALRTSAPGAGPWPAAATLALALDRDLAHRGQHRARLELLAPLLAPASGVAGATTTDGDHVALHAELLLGHGTALRELGELAAAGAAFAQVATLAAPARTRALALARQAELTEIAGQTDTAQAALAGALALLDARGPGADADDQAALAEVWARLAHAHRREGALAEAAIALTRAQTLFALGRRRDGLAAMAYEAGVIALFRRAWAGADAAFRESLALATELGAPLLVGAARSGLGILVQAQGQLGEAIALHAEAAREFRDLGQRHREGSALYYLAGAYLERGEATQALIVAAQALVEIRAVGAPRYLALLHALVAVARHHLGDADGAGAALAEATDAATACAREPGVGAVVALVRAAVAGVAPAPTGATTAALLGDDVHLFERLLAPSARADATTAGGPVVRISGAGALDGPGLAAPIDLRRRAALRQIVLALGQQRVAAPGEALSLDQLVAAGWPGERMRADAAINRVHVALSTLRRLGLRDLLHSGPHGYLLDPAAAVELVP